jgi:hypothetical protein
MQIKRATAIVVALCFSKARPVPFGHPETPYRHMLGHTFIPCILLADERKKKMIIGILRDTLRLPA